MSEATLEQAPAAAVPYADAMAAIEQERKEARAELNAYAHKIADGQPVVPATLRDLMRKADVDQSFIDERVETRRTRIAAMESIEKAGPCHQRAAERRAQAMQLKQRHDAEKAELERKYREEVFPLEAQSAQLDAEASQADSEGNRHTAWGRRTLLETAPEWIDARIKRLQSESARIDAERSPIQSHSCDISNGARNIQRRAAFWRGFLAKADMPFPLPMQRPQQMPDWVRKSAPDYSAWRWFFSNQNPVAGGEPIHDAREHFVQGLEREVESEHARLNELKERLRPLLARQGEIKAEIERLEAKKLELD